MGRKKKHVKKDVKIKINGKEQLMNEEIVIKDWNKAKEETAAAEEELQGEEFEWVLPEKKMVDIPEFQSSRNDPGDENAKEENKRKKLNFTGYFHKRMVPSKASLIISTMLAVAIGLGFGIFVWKLVVAPESGISLTDATAVTSSEQEKKQSAALTVKMPELSVAVVQGGVFSTKETAVQNEERFSEQGFPTASLTIDGQQFLFVGITPDITTAKTWAEQYKSSGTDVYAKEFSIPEQQVKADSQADAEWLAAAMPVFQTLAKEAAGAQLNGQVDSQALQEAGKVITKYEGQKGDLKNEINGAYEQLSAFSSSGDQSSLVKAQQSLLNFLKAYYDAGQQSSV